MALPPPRVRVLAVALAFVTASARVALNEPMLKVSPEIVEVAESVPANKTSLLLTGGAPVLQVAVIQSVAVVERKVSVVFAACEDCVNIPATASPRLRATTLMNALLFETC